jgi:hypothetical protein
MTHAIELPEIPRKPTPRVSQCLEAILAQELAISLARKVIVVLDDHTTHPFKIHRMTMMSPEIVGIGILASPDAMPELVKTLLDYSPSEHMGDNIYRIGVIGEPGVVIHVDVDLGFESPKVSINN